MNFQNSCSCFFIRCWQLNFSVKSSWSKKGWIKDINSICCCDNFNVNILTESVKLVEKLEHCSLDFSVSSFFWTKSFCSNSIKLINENDCWSFLSCKIKSVSYHFSTISNEHLNKRCTRKFQKCCFSLSSTSSSKQSFSCSWWSKHQHSFWRLDSKTLKSFFMSHW